MSAGDDDITHDGPAPHVVDVILTFDAELSPGLNGIQKLSPEEN